ncbi:NgoMIV family type II restriction endonuclease [Streptomyces sp. CB02261]|uniref:NgoMIV family type II restriction endonuclease n=1 Tax=Streptomyces sp. CB02261 TaxID=1703940 RepID=UPI000938C4DC|nr:NgoMIV family type II restriction endonuclease [Streptomyces sp. CB02261]OKJ69700.1 restriction endonuclease [Streptomyces sp. CB02261]
MSAPFAAQLLNWKLPKNSKVLVPNSADTSSETSKGLAAAILEDLQIPRTFPAPKQADPGPALEVAVHLDLAETLIQLNDERKWQVDHKKVVSAFSQYTHLAKISRLLTKYPELRTELGRDYIIRPDVTVGMDDSPQLGATQPFLHAAVSCKWTIRSDRVQNIRHEFLQMIRHRRGRLPHLVAVTAEPMPSRIAAIARGTGEVDAVYHIAFESLAKAVDAVGNSQQKDDWQECVEQGRVLPYEQLAGTLAGW